ncbi:MAG: hypothetical protein ACOCQD_05195 [archaeon]
MNKDLKDIQKWRELTEKILHEQDEETEEETEEYTDKWIVFIGEGDELEEGEEARKLAYQAKHGEEDIVEDMSASEALRFQSQVEDENRDTKQVDVIYEDGDYICNENDVIFVKTV